MNDLGTLGGSISRAFGLNDHGDVVGESTAAAGYSIPAHAFRFNGGTMSDLGTLGGASSAAYAINSAGMIVGQAERADGAVHAFEYINGSMYDLGTLGGANSVARGINRWGQIVGSAQTASGLWHAFLVTNGRMIDLNSITSGTAGVLAGANAINDYGRIVGDLLTNDTRAAEPDPWPNPTTGDWQRYGFDARSSDTTAPTCALHGSGQSAPGRKFVRYEIGDNESGLAEATLLNASNAELDASFDPGATDVQLVTVNRQDTTLPWSFTLRVRDIAGNSTLCPQ